MTTALARAKSGLSLSLGPPTSEPYSATALHQMTADAARKISRARRYAIKQSSKSVENGACHQVAACAPFHAAVCRSALAREPPQVAQGRPAQQPVCDEPDEHAGY